MQSPMISESATSRAIACPDIIIEIIEQTSLPSHGALRVDPEHERRLLSALSLVCQAFNKPATKALWSRLDSFHPLLGLFSAFDDRVVSPNSAPTYVSRWNREVPHANNLHPKMISGDISPHEFSRFRELGSFVRAVVPHDGCVCDLVAINPDVWPYLAQQSGGKSLFPHLRELHWTIQEASGTELLFIVSSSLRRLFVCYGLCSTDSREWMLSQSMLFRTIFNIAPHLTHLLINDIHDALFPACLSNLPALRTLRMVSLDQDEPVNSGVLRMLSSVESLEELSIAVSSIGHVDFSGFPALKKLDVSIEGPSYLFLDAFSSPRLRRLSLRNGPNLTDTDELFMMSTAIAQRFPAIADLELVLSFQVRNGGTSLETALTPLFPLSLIHFSLESSNSLVGPFTGDLFAALAQSWPHLLELSFVTPQLRDGVLSRAGITARTLLALARACPQLQTLRLPRIQSPQQGEISEYPVLQHPLRTLIVDCLDGGSLRRGVVAEEEHVACALLLDKLFPDLDTRNVPWPTFSSDAWRRVLYGVRLCQLGRSNRAS